MGKPCNIVAALVVTALNLSSFSAWADVPNSRPNVVVVEGLGRTIFYHLGYERRIGERVALGVGASHRRLSAARLNETETLVPIYTTVYFKLWGQRFFATEGFNLGLFTNNANGKTVASIDIGAALGVGYEFRANNGLLARATGYLLIGGTILPWFGGTVGYAW
jgi:hypothetical protein